MSDFVNYNKRSITLPPGCKDLVDVLRQEGRNLEWLEKCLGIDLSRAITRGGTRIGRFQDIQKSVQQAMTGSALIFILKIIPADQRVTFTLQRLYQRSLQAMIEVETRTPQEQALLRSLAVHRLRVPNDAQAPGMWFADLPWRLTCPIEPLPADALALSGLISELLRETSGLKPDAELAFDHHELVMPA